MCNLQIFTVEIADQTRNDHAYVKILTTSVTNYILLLSLLSCPSWYRKMVKIRVVGIPKL